MKMFKSKYFKNYDNKYFNMKGIKVLKTFCIFPFYYLCQLLYSSIQFKTSFNVISDLYNTKQ